MIADALDRFSPGMIGYAVLGLVAALMVVALVLTVLNQWSQFRAHRAPAFDADLKRYSASLEKMKADLAKLPPSEKFEALIERLGNFATVNQIAALELSFEQQIKEARAYSHNEAHNAREIINAWQIHSQDRAERLASLEADMKNITRWLESISKKLDTLGSRSGRAIDE